MEKVGVYLPTPCFVHGQLYVAMSRVGRIDAIKCYVPPNTEFNNGGGVYTRNVVYNEVLTS